MNYIYKNLEKNYKFLILITLLSVLSIILLIPYIRNGFWFDDALNSEVYGAIKRFNYSLINFSTRVSHLWLNNGRILFGWIETYSIFYFIKELIYLRIISITFLIINILIFSCILRQLKATYEFIIVFIVITIGLFQIRLYFDPIGAFLGFYQILVIHLSIAIYYLLKWRLSRNKNNLILSGMLILISLLHYEINLIYYPIAFFIVWFHQKGWDRIRDETIVICPMAVYIGFNFLVRWKAAGFYEGSSFGSPSLFLQTYLKQLISTFPGSYYILCKKSIGTFSIYQYLESSHYAWIIIIISIIILIFILRSPYIYQSLDRYIYLIAFALLLIPPAFVASSMRYQKELIWGIGYLPVYYQYFGLSILLTMTAFFVFKNVNSIYRMALILIFSIYLAVNWAINMHVSNLLDETYKEPRITFEAAIRNGLFKDVQDGDIIDIKDQPNFINGNLIFQYTEKRIITPEEPASHGLFKPIEPRVGAHHFVLYRDGSIEKKWHLSDNFYTLGTVESFDANGNGLRFETRGWGRPEDSTTESIILGPVGELSINIGEMPLGQSYDLTVDGTAFIVKQHPKQIVKVIVNGHELTTWVFDENAPRGLRTAHIPADIAESQKTWNIQFLPIEPVSPLQVGYNADPRVLGMGLITLLIKPSDF